MLNFLVIVNDLGSTIIGIWLVNGEESEIITDMGFCLDLNSDYLSYLNGIVWELLYLLSLSNK